jgi:hypothetical protein
MIAGALPILACVALWFFWPRQERAAPAPAIEEKSPAGV